MDRAKGVTDFVGNDEPFAGGFGDDVGTGRGLVGVSAGGGVVDAHLAEPGVADCWAGDALGQHGCMVLATESGQIPSENLLQ